MGTPVFTVQYVTVVRAKSACACMHVCACGWVLGWMRVHVRAGPATLLRAHVSLWLTLRLANSGAVCFLSLVASK